MAAVNPGDLHPELDPVSWEEWGRRLRELQGPAAEDHRLFLKGELIELLHFARAISMFNIAGVLRTSLFVPFGSGWNRYVNLVAMEIDAMHNRMMGEYSASDEELEHQWALSGLKRP